MGTGARTITNAYSATTFASIPTYVLAYATGGAGYTSASGVGSRSSTSSSESTASLIGAETGSTRSTYASRS
jgi:hypothetical protein